MNNVPLRDRVKEGWLSNYPNDIKSLSIYSNDLEDIGAKSFSGKPFGPLELELVETHIKYLRENMFEGSKITTFAFRLDNPGYSIKVESNVFGQIANTLISLQFTKCLDDPVAIQNMTGEYTTNILTTLNIFDLRENLISNLNAKSFVRTRKLTSLYLTSSKLLSLDVASFHGLDSLELLQLEDNIIEILPEGIFDQLVSIKHIFINKNNFMCNCSMVWFKDYFKKHKDDYFDQSQFKCNNDFDYSDTVFCDQDTSEDDGTITTTPAVNLIDINCKMAPSVVPFFDRRELSHHDSITNSLLTINQLYYNDDVSIEIIIDNLEVYESYHLLYFTMEKNVKCFTDISKNIVLPNLPYNETYTACFMWNSSTKTKPSDCISFRTPLHLLDQSFIKNKNIPVVITLVTLGFLILSTVDVVGVFYLIRKYPKLIKGNKRVVIIKNSGFDAILMPKSHKPQSKIGYFLKRKFYRKHSNKICEPPLPPNHPTKK